MRVRVSRMGCHETLARNPLTWLIHSHYLARTVASERIIGVMSDKPDDSTDSIPVPEPTPSENAATGPTYAPPEGYLAPAEVPPHEHKASRLNKIAAWVGIFAGAVVIVAVIFGTGFMLGAHSGHYRGGAGGGFGHDRGGAMEHRDGPPMWGPGPMMRPGPAFVFPGPGFQGGPGSQGGPFQSGPGGSGQGPTSPQPNQPGR